MIIIFKFFISVTMGLYIASQILITFQLIADGHKDYTNLAKLQILLQFAQAQALRSQAKVWVCPSQNGQDCLGNWEKNGFLLQQNNKSIYFFQPHPSLNSKKLIFNNPVKKILFLADGSTNCAGTFFYVKSNWFLTINLTGYTKIERFR